MLVGMIGAAGIRFVGGSTGLGTTMKGGLSSTPTVIAIRVAKAGDKSARRRLEG